MDDDSAPLPLYDDDVEDRDFYSDIGSDGEPHAPGGGGSGGHRRSKQSNGGGAALSGAGPGHLASAAHSAVTSSESFPLGGGPVDEVPDHCHVQKPNKDDVTARKQLIAVTILCVVFIIGEVIGGIFANSLALLSDATHLGSDLTSFVISIIALYLAKKPPTKKLNFGFFRAEILGAVVSVLIIWIVTAVLVYLAIERIIHRDYDINADDMLITSAVGVAFNLVMAMVLNMSFFKCRVSHGHSHGGGGHSHGGGGHSHGGHGHSHGGDAHSHGGHGHSHAIRNRRNGDDSSCDDRRSTSSDGHGDDAGGAQQKQSNIVIRAAFIHVLGDLIQSIGVLIAAYIIKYKPEWKLADPICTFLFSILVLLTTFTVLRDAFRVVMEGTPRDLNFEELHMSLSEIPRVRSVHSLKVWSLTVNENVANVHIAIDDGTDGFDVLKRASHLLRTKYGIYDSTVQIEKYQPNVMSQCNDCLRNTGKSLQL